MGAYRVYDNVSGKLIDEYLNELIATNGGKFLLKDNEKDLTNRIKRSKGQLSNMIYNCDISPYRMRFYNKECTKVLVGLHIDGQYNVYLYNVDKLGVYSKYQCLIEESASKLFRDYEARGLQFLWRRN